MARLGVKALGNVAKTTARQRATGRYQGDKIVVGCVEEQSDSEEVKQRYGEHHCYFGTRVQ